MAFLVLLILFISSEATAAEPSIQEVQQETVRTLGFDHKEIESWKKRSRLSAVLPRLQFGFERELKDVVSLSTKDSVSVTGGEVFIGPDENDFDQDFNQGTSFDVKAVWMLNELIFNRDSLAASNERRDWIREKNRALQEVTEAYFTRRRLIDELKSRKEPLEVREKRKLLLDQMNAMIDAYTNGWFSGEINR